MAILSLNAVLNYSEITPNSRNLIDAEKILAAKQKRCDKSINLNTNLNYSK